MAKTTPAHLHLVSAPPTDDLAAYVWRELEDVMWELRRVRHLARCGTQTYTRGAGRDTTAMGEATTDLYRVIERLFVIGAKMQGRDFYARSTE